MTEIRRIEKFKIDAIVPKWLPVREIREISMNSQFQLYCITLSKKVYIASSEELYLLQYWCWTQILTFLTHIVVYILCLLQDFLRKYCCCVSTGHLASVEIVVLLCFRSVEIYNIGKYNLLTCGQTPT